MSESVVPTPSEEPTCKHGETEGHDDIVYTPAGQRLIYCSGPVIATPNNENIETTYFNQGVRLDSLVAA